MQCTNPNCKIEFVPRTKASRYCTTECYRGSPENLEKANKRQRARMATQEGKVYQNAYDRARQAKKVAARPVEPTIDPEEKRRLELLKGIEKTNKYRLTEAGKTSLKKYNNSPERKAYMKERHKRVWAERKARGLCVHCGLVSRPDRVLCESCKDRDTQKNAVRMKTDLNAKIASYLRRRLLCAIKQKNKAGSAVRDLGCTIPELIKHLEAQFTPGMTWGNQGEWHIDHRVPLASFDLSNREQFLEACSYKNLQPLWASENISKSDNLVSAPTTSEWLTQISALGWQAEQDFESMQTTEFNQKMHKALSTRV